VDEIKLFGRFFQQLLREFRILAILHLPERVVAVKKVHDPKFRVVAVSRLPQRVLVVFFAH
jgi:hypothetical protein